MKLKFTDKRILVVFLTFLFTCPLFSQRKDATMDNYNRKILFDKKFKQERENYERVINDWVQSSLNKKSAQQVPIVIPVVFHILYSNASQNIPDPQILSQLSVLNEDFGRTNADTSNTPLAFQSVAANTGIQFCLAQRDPNGNPTTGIERRSTTVASFGFNDAMKSFSTGGLNAWDVSKYLNIWVCNIGGGILGYGEFPAGAFSNTYGLVIQYDACGNLGTAAPPYDLGRTSTHEIGHCLDLSHIWGDDNGSCTGSDGIGDTPNSASEMYGCPSYPHTDACSPANPGIMFMNYMDYTDDACMNMFTQGQAVKMLAVLNNPPYNSLQASNACVPVILQSDDAGISKIVSPLGTYCVGLITPVVILKNWGINALTSATINYRVDNGTIMSFNYIGNLASLDTVGILLPVLSVANGPHTFTSYTSLPNLLQDMDASNDTINSNFIVAGGIGQNLPYVEGFELTPFPQNGITLNNPDGLTTWARTTVAKKTGLASVYMDDFNYAGTGEIDDMILPPLNLSSVANPQLRFQLAYRLYTNPAASPNYSDTLAVLMSADCGQTWVQLYKKFGAALATATPVFSTTSFSPTAAQWRLESINLSSYSAVNNAIFKFHHSCDYENQMYIDDINIDTAISFVGIEALDISNLVSIFPNPANNEFVIHFNEQIPVASTNINITDQLGRSVMSKIEINFSQYSVTINTSSLASGTYLVRINSNGRTAFKKIVIQR